MLSKKVFVALKGAKLPKFRCIVGALEISLVLEVYTFLEGFCHGFYDFVTHFLAYKRAFDGFLCHLKPLKS